MFEKATPYRLLPIDSVRPDASQPRKHFDAAELAALAASIKQVGIIQPLTVRREADGYILIAGERRWRAAAMAGLRELPCIICAPVRSEARLMSLIENLQRRDLNPFEEAEGIQSLIAETGMTQQEAARQLGKSQSCVANKLRLLSLSPALREEISAAGLSERHARALLSLPEDKRGAALSGIVAGKMPVERAERYIEAVNAPEKPRRKAYFKDIRIFINTIDKSLRLLATQGIGARADKKEDENCVYYSIVIPKRRA